MLHFFHAIFLAMLLAGLLLAIWRAFCSDIRDYPFDRPVSQPLRYFAAFGFFVLRLILVLVVMSFVNWALPTVVEAGAEWFRAQDQRTLETDEGVEITSDDSRKEFESARQNTNAPKRRSITDFLFPPLP